MISYKLSEEAEKDVESILLYTQTIWGDLQFEKYAGEIYRMFEKLTKNPDLGTSANHIFEGVRKMPIGKHVILYIYRKNTVFIVRIIHQSSDVKKPSLTFNL